MLVGNTAYEPPAPGFEHLQTDELGSNSATITISNIDTQYAADYQHIQLRMVTKQTQSAAGAGDLSVRFNGISTSDYSWVRFGGSGTSEPHTHNGGTIGSFGDVGPYNDSSSPNSWGVIVIDFFDCFDSTKGIAAKFHSGGVNNAYSWVNMGTVWLNNSSDLSSIFFDVYDQFKAGTRVSLYGYRKAS
jgi:hypothetical protein